MDQNQNPSTPNQTPPPSSSPTQPSVPPTLGATPATSSNPSNPNQTPGQTPPPAGHKSKKAGIIAAVAVFLVLFGIAAALLLPQSQNQQPATPTAVPTAAEIQTDTPNLEPTQNLQEEIDAVDTGASESSDLNEAQQEAESLD